MDMRKLDALVERHLFERNAVLAKDAKCRLAEAFEPTEYIIDGGYYITGVPFYSSSIESAWQVVGRMSALGWMFKVEEWTTLGDEKRWLAEFTKPGGIVISDDAWGASVPLAICLAALRALGVEVPTE